MRQQNKGILLCRGRHIRTGLPVSLTEITSLRNLSLIVPLAQFNFFVVCLCLSWHPLKINTVLYDVTVVKYECTTRLSLYNTQSRENEYSTMLSLHNTQSL